MRIALLEGYQMAKHKKHKKAHGRNSALAKAAKKCKGQKGGKFRACVKKHAKK